MKEQIDRLGFPTWADNLIVDFIESHPEMSNGNYGSITTERKDGTAIRAVHGGGKIDIVIRAYTGQGWEIHERQIKIQ